MAWAPAAAAVRGMLRLLRCCPDGVNAADREGYTLLHRLALAGQPRCLELLLAAGGEGEGPDLLLRTRSGANALQLAKQQRHEACVLLLEAATQQAAEARQAALLKVGAALHSWAGAAGCWAPRLEHWGCRALLPPLPTRAPANACTNPPSQLSHACPCSPLGFPLGVLCLPAGA